MSEIFLSREMAEIAAWLLFLSFVVALAWGEISHLRKRLTAVEDRQHRELDR